MKWIKLLIVRYLFLSVVCLFCFFSQKFKNKNKKQPQLWNCYDDNGEYYGQALLFDRETVQFMDAINDQEEDDDDDDDDYNYDYSGETIIDVD